MSTSHPLAWLLFKKKENKTKKVLSIGEDVEKLKPMCTVSENIKYYTCCENQYGVSSKN
jgi:hypothetical protein